MSYNPLSNSPTSPRASSSSSSRNRPFGGRRTSYHPAAREAELEAAFDDGADQVNLRLEPDNTDVFFDAGDAMGDDGAAASCASERNQGDDPLGATFRSGPLSASSASYAPPPTFRNHSPPAPAGDASSYDFERPSYFAPSSGSVGPSNPIARRPSGASSHPRVPSGASAGTAGEDEGADLDLGFADADGPGSSLGNNPSNSASALTRARVALGRFGRFVGMRVPGASGAYSSLSTEENARGSGHARAPTRYPIGGGVASDGVFANMSAKPERRRRRTADPNNPDDRGDDDDLAEDEMPPTYDVAAADAAPPYWETTIVGGAHGLHPLGAAGLINGWTPGGSHVGAIEDLIVEGLPVGNFFGFAWNLLVSMSFQFVGFLLTYLLHTTHAAKCGSRAGLGITLIQYGFYLRTRALQIADGKFDDGPSGSGGLGGSSGGEAHRLGGWWGDIDDTDATTSAGGSRSLLGRYTADASQPTLMGTNTTLAEALASASDDSNGLDPAAMQAGVGASTEWLAYALMVIGWFMLLSSLLGYWRVHRWGRQLVEAARRDQEGANGGRDGSAEGAGHGNVSEGDAQDTDAPTGFLSHWRTLTSRGGGDTSSRPRGHSAEDWVIFPGLGHRLGTSLSRSPPTASSTAGRGDGGLDGLPGRSGASLDAELARDEEDDGMDEETERHLSPEERRLIQDMRNVGLIS